MKDLISRQAAIDAVCEYCEYFKNEKVIQRIKEIPSVQPEEVARDIATIIENEKDMRVILKNAQPQQVTGKLNDCISRQAAVGAVKDAVITEEQPYAVEALNCVPSVQPQMWIPVTPDSPPLYMPVLTWDGGTRHVEQRIPYIRDEIGEKIFNDWWIDGDEKWDEWAEYQPNLRDGCAIKWMPLPEPWRGGQNETN